MYDVARLLAEAPIERCERHDLLASTNDRARELAGELDAIEDRRVRALVLAEEQTAGRGRGSNRWWTGRGSIAGSLLFDPASFGVPKQHHYLLSLATALATVEAVAPLAPPRSTGIHWPNDVYVGDRKLAGILVESLHGGWHIVGFGVNANNRAVDAPAEVTRKVETLRDLTGGDIDRTGLVIELLNHWRRFTELLADDPAAVARAAHEMCLQIGRSLTIAIGQERVTGVCRGIASDGALLLETPGGTRPFYSGVLE